MGSVRDAYDNLLKSAALYGELNTVVSLASPGGTSAAPTTAGYYTAQRFPTTFTVPSLSAPLTGVYFPTIRLYSTSNSASSMMCGLEYLLGTFNFGTNTYTASGISMPTKDVFGESIQTAAELAAVVPTSALTTSANWDLTITYTNQAGSTGRTATLSGTGLGGAVNSAFMVNPHMQGSDTGIRAVTNISAATRPAAGVVAVYGVLPLHWQEYSTVGIPTGQDPLHVARPDYICAAGETISFWRFNTVSTNNGIVQMFGVAESTVF